jgi:hypothetical protein
MTARLHSQFFAPLVDARRRAAEARTPDAAIRAFDVIPLTQELDRLIERVVGAWPDERTPARRALRASLRERAEDYARSIEQLRDSGARALAAPDADKLIAWREWTAQLVATFQAADRSWMALRSVVERIPEAESG